MAKANDPEMFLTFCIPDKLGTCHQNPMSSGPPLVGGTPSAFAVTFTMTLTFHFILGHWLHWGNEAQGILQW